MKFVHQLIQKGTGADNDNLATIENIMREEIFHSTLDWRTREQLVAGARQVRQCLAINQEWYSQEYQSQEKMLHQMQAQSHSASN